MPAHVDHLVIAAANLEDGVRWCEAALGVTPGPGGAHPLMGTHNRLVSIAGGAFPRCYMEIIAVDPAQRPTRERHKHRWFDLDDSELRHALTQHGPRLIHFVARVPDVHATVHALAANPWHIARGVVLEAGRDTPAGRLQWQITVRDDGQRLFYGALPTLIQWGPAHHPADTLPPSGVTLSALTASHPRAPALATALQTIGLSEALTVGQGAPNLVATLQTPRGVVRLESQGL